ncbi:MAG: Ig-like domain-containing protein [Deltaproteobacteria bacterium]|nr:Ig-like domain-containing protein [Deltaproteobacteria bacterium]
MLRPTSLPALISLSALLGLSAACSGEPEARDSGPVDSARGDGSTPPDAAPEHDARGDGDGSTGPDDPTPVEVPAQQPPSAPGWLEVRPAGLVLRPGEMGTFTAEVYQLTGEHVVPAGVVWTSSAPEVLAVDATGRVVAVAAGEAELVVTDAAGHTRRVSVTVSETPPDVPVAFAADRPLVLLEPGTETVVPFALTSAHGDPATASVTVTSAGSPSIDATLEGSSFHLTARAPGVARLGLLAGSRAVVGTLIVVVPDRSRPRPPSCDGVSAAVDGCWLSSEPLVFTAPSAPGAILRLTAVETPCDSDWPFVHDVSPSDVTIGDRRVLRLDGAGAIAPVAPGWSAYGVRYRGVPCDCPTATVSPDVNGCWSIACAGGETGWLMLGGWHSKVFRGCPTDACASRDFFFGHGPATGTGYMAYEAAPRFECQDAAAFTPTIGTPGRECRVTAPPAGGEERWVAQGRLCEEDGCISRDIEFCGSSRINGGTEPLITGTTIWGAGRFDYLSCSFTAGGSCVAPPPPETSVTTFLGDTRMGGTITVHDSWRTYMAFGIEQRQGDRSVKINLAGISAPGSYPGFAGPWSSTADCTGCAFVEFIRLGPDPLNRYSGYDCGPGSGAAGMIEVEEIGGGRLSARYTLYAFPRDPERACSDRSLPVTGEFSRSWVPLPGM